MTPNERTIISCLRETKEKTHIRLIAKKTNLSSDYARLLCRSLARSGHIEFENDLAHLLKKERSRFSAEGGSPSSVAELLRRTGASGGENNLATAAEKFEPVITTANVTLLTDEPARVSPTSNRSDEELDKALADLEPSFKKDESEEKDKPEEPKDETELESEPKVMVEEEKPAVASADAAFSAQGYGRPKKAVADKEAMAGKEKGLTEEAKAENPERVALKEKPAKPSGGFGASFKKFVNWFAEKK